MKRESKIELELRIKFELNESEFDIFEIWSNKLRWLELKWRVINIFKLSESKMELLEDMNLMNFHMRMKLK